MRTIDIHEAKARLSELVERAARGEPFLIATSGTPRVMVVPLDAPQAGQLGRIGFLERCAVVPEEIEPSSEAECERVFG